MPEPALICARFEQTPVGTVGPIISIPMQITGVNTASAPQVVNSLVGLSHAFFFEDQGSAPNWVFANEVLDNAGATISQLDQFVELNSTTKFFGVRFVGVNSNRIRVTRDPGHNWMLDDVRFSYATGQFVDSFESPTR